MHASGSPAVGFPVNDSERPHRPSALYLRAGGDKVTLENARARAEKRLRMWLQSQRLNMMQMSEEVYESAITTLLNIVSTEVANVALDVQESINARVRAIKPDVHESTTAQVNYSICSKCAAAIPHEPLRRETSEFEKP